MPDADRHPERLPPACWNEAFAALPLEAPDEAQRARIVATLQARTGLRLARTRARRLPWAVGGALAAGIALALVVAWPPPPPASPSPVAARPSTPRRTAPAAVESPVRAPAERRASTGIASAQRVDSGPALPPRRARPAAAATRGAQVPPALPQPAATRTATAASPSDSDALIRLQRESAQLEALVMLARNDRVASAPAAVMASELDDRVASIDAALTDPQLGETERRQLWQQRVEALRELAGLEGTQRWLAANGESYDGALVSVD